jgi:predicted polyphosphate/ATP-dependent NAD kinase
MKKMMTISAGVFSAISIISLIFGCIYFGGKFEIENEIKDRDIVSGTKNKESALDEIETARRFQRHGTFALIVAGGSGALAVGLAVAGKDKDKLKK